MNLRRVFFILPPSSFILLFLLSCSDGRSYFSASRALSPTTGFLQKTTPTGTKYAVFIPHTYNPAKKYPTIVFLHGIGEAGSDGHRHLPPGLGSAIRQRERTFPFIAIFPQSTGMWREGRIPLVMETLDLTIEQYNVDTDRVYLTGISSGGQGTWIVGARRKDRFAALAPMCGYHALSLADKLTDVPIWAFHNALDPFVPSTDTIAMVNKINAAGGHAKLTALPIPLHDCWTAAYNDDLFTWLLQHRRSNRSKPQMNADERR